MLRSNRFVSLLLLAALLVSACQPIVAQPSPVVDPPPTRILFIGDSFTCWHTGLDAHLKAMAESIEPSSTVETASVCIGSTPLEGMWNDGRALEQIRAGNWDVVVLQEDLAMYGARTDIFEQAQETFHTYVKKFDEEIRQQGARTVLYLPQSRNYELTIRFEKFRQAYETVAAEIDATVAPAGVAWQRAAQEHPNLILYEGDASHASIHGFYLTTCVLYATLFGEMPEGLSYMPADMLPDSKAAEDLRRQWQMMPEVRDQLQRIAWETVADSVVQP